MASQVYRLKPTGLGEWGWMKERVYDVRLESERTAGCGRCHQEAAITMRAIHCQAATHVVAEGGNVENLLKTQVSVNKWIFHEARFTR